MTRGLRYTAEDAAAAPEGRLQLVGTQIELVAYCRGEDLVILVNRGGERWFLSLASPGSTR